MKQLKITQRITDRDSRSLNSYFNEVRNYGQLTADEEVELADRIKQGDEAALQKLVECNLRFVVSVAKQYQNRGVALPDLINEGNMGLIKAATRFDASRGFKFISYAVWWIRQAMIHAISTNSRMVRLPQNQVDVVRKVNDAFTKLEQKIGRDPSADEVAELLEMKDSDVDKYLGLNAKPLSLDAPFGDDETGSLMDVLPVDSPSTDHQTDRQSLKDTLYLSLGRLTNKEREVIQMTFGIGTEEAATLDDIADRFSLSRERVRQIRDKAIRKLRHSPFRNQLKAYLG